MGASQFRTFSAPGARCDEGFRALRAAMLDMRALDLGDVNGNRVASVSTTPSRPTPTFGPRARRPHTNEAPTRHQSGLVKPNSARSAGPGRQTTPADSQDHLGAVPGGSVATAHADRGAGHRDRRRISEPAGSE